MSLLIPGIANWVGLHLLSSHEFGQGLSKMYRRSFATGRSPCPSPGAAGLSHCSAEFAAFPIVVNVGSPVRAFTSHGTRAHTFLTSRWHSGTGTPATGCSQHHTCRVSVGVRSSGGLAGKTFHFGG